MKKIIMFLISSFMVPMVFGQIIFEPAQNVIDCSQRSDCNDLRNVIVTDINGDGLPDIVAREVDSDEDGIDNNTPAIVKVFLQEPPVHESHNLIPVLFSNSSASPIVVSASTYHGNGDLQPWKAFNDDASAWDTGQCLDAITGWVQVDFGSNRIVTSYKVRGRDDLLTYSYKDWTFEGSINGSSWTVLDTKSISDWVAGEYMTFPILEADYRYYRWNITNTNGGSIACAQELEIWGYEPD